MRKFPTRLACLAALLASGCSDVPPRVYPPNIDAAAAGSAAMQQYDKDSDGMVSGDELEQAPSLRSAIKNLDLDNDGAVTATEIAARIQNWQETQIALTPIVCYVTYRGQPLAGANVIFEPEKFLGKELKPCVGKTSRKGTASLRIKDSELNLPGGAPGLYIIRITSPKIQIPEQYNTQTILGAEIAIDSANAERGVRIDLDG